MAIAKHLIGTLPAEGTLERKVLDALLTHEFMSTTAIGKKLGKPRNHVSPSISNLRSRGLIESVKAKRGEFKHKRLKNPKLVPQGNVRNVVKKKKRRANAATLENRILIEAARMENAFNTIRDLVTDLRASVRREVEDEIMASLREKKR